MLTASGFLVERDGKYDIADSSNRKMEIPTELIPNCPDCGEPMNMNLRCDDTFVQDDGWYAAKAGYDEFIKNCENKHVLYLELGVGANTPVWIKYPFWRMTKSNPKASYACLNYGEAYAPAEIRKRSICLDSDIAEILKSIVEQK